ncbi:MAG: hypothetical protein ABSB40_01655 [Nitrososphaeria archaeon]|jgi:hypothetical protein
MSKSLELIVGKDGKVIVSQDILAMLGIKEGDKLELRIEGSVISIHKMIENNETPPPLHLLYRPEITIDLINGEELKRDLNLEARLMTIPFFAMLAKRGFFIMSEKNRAIAFKVRTVDDAIDLFLANGKISEEDLLKAGIKWPK